MNKIEENLIYNLENNLPVTLSTIGGVEGLEKDKTEILSSKFLDVFLSTLVTEVDLDDRKKNLFVTDFFSEGLIVNKDEITVREVILIVCSYPEKLSGCFNTLLNLLSDTERSSFFKSQYLLAAFQIAAFNKAKKHYLIGYLLEEENIEDQNYFSHYVKVLGLSYSFFQDESIFEKLSHVMNKNDDDDGNYEMGMSYLGKGISAKTSMEAYQSFVKAKDCFSKVDYLTYTDAYCMDLILEVLFEVIDRTLQPEKMQDILDKIENAIRLSSGWHQFHSSLPWACARDTEMLNWFQLTSILKKLMVSLEEISWFDPKVVIENYLLQIYNCNRSLLRKESGTGLDLIIQPIIQKKFNENDTYVYLLEKWIISQPKSDLWTDAKKLRKDISDYKESIFVGKALGTVETAVLTVPFDDRIPDEKKSEFIEFARGYMSIQFNNTSYIIREMFEKIVKELEVIESFKTYEIGFNFKKHVFNTLKFLESRMDATKSNLPAAAYLFRKGEKESALQNDFNLYMGSVPSDGKLQIEVNNIAGGRADVVFNHIDHQFIFEIKRELSDSSFENIRQKYLGQASEYQNTGPKLGGLLVLDLTNDEGSVGAFEDNVKVEFVFDTFGNPVRAVLVVKVVGNRTTPSNIKLA